MHSLSSQTKLAIVFLAVAFASIARSGGVGISTLPEAQDTVLVSPCQSGGGWTLFFNTRVGLPPLFRSRDLEFFWDSLYSAARGYYGFSSADLASLDSLGRSIADTAGVNPFGAPYTDIRLVHDYFNYSGATYDANPFHPYGFFVSSATDPPQDRAHVDVYVPAFDRGVPGGMFPSAFKTVQEDSSTGRWGRPGIPDTVFHCNSLHAVGPSVAAVGNPAWARPDYTTNGAFNHEFQHVIVQGGGLSSEMLSSAAEAVAGHRPVERILNDCGASLGAGGGLRGRPPLQVGAL